MKPFAIQIMSLPILLLMLPNLAGADVEVRQVSVSGACMKRVQPDRGSVTLVAQFTNKSASVAAKKAMETYGQIRKAVQQMKLKNLEMQTSEYSLQEEFDFVANKQVSRGYRGSLGLQIHTSEIDRLGEVAALTSKMEINRVENLSTYLSEEKTKEHQEACLVEAIQNARAKADKMALAASAKVGEVIHIEEGASGRISGRPMEYSMASAKVSAMASDAPMIESKSSVISVNVNVRFALR